VGVVRIVYQHVGFVVRDLYLCMVGRRGAGVMLLLALFGLAGGHCCCRMTDRDLSAVE
jgi:hypothetical protein